MRLRKQYDDGGQIASTILQQLGGANRLHAMTGAYNFINIGNGLTFKIKNQRANYIKITLTSMDLYNIEVGRIRGNTYKVVSEAQGLYSDQLKPFIEKATGMYLTLGRGFAKGGETGQMYLELGAMPDYDDYEDDYKWDTDFRHIEEYKVPISSFEEASKIVTEFIEDNDLGSSNFTGGDIFQNDIQIARVGYNGKVYKAEHYFDGKQKRTRFEERLFENGGMITITSDDGEVLKYKIDTDEKSIEVDEATKKYLTDIVLVMDRDFRKLNNTYIFWYDEMSDEDIKELEEVFQTTLTKFAKGGLYATGITSKKEIIEQIKRLRDTIESQDEYNKELQSGKLSDYEIDLIENTKLPRLSEDETYYRSNLEFLIRKYNIEHGKDLSIPKNLYVFMKAEGFADGGKINEWFEKPHNLRYISNRSPFHIELNNYDCAKKIKNKNSQVEIIKLVNNRVSQPISYVLVIKNWSSVDELKNIFTECSNHIISYGFTSNEQIDEYKKMGSSMADGGEMEDDTFVMLFKGYGFVEKRGSYGTRTFYNKEHNAYIYYDPKIRNISGYVGGGEGNDEVIPYSVVGVLDFFIEHDISESEATPLADGGKVKKPFFRDRTAKLREPFNKGFEGLAKATGHESLTKMASGGNVWDEDLNVYTLVSSKEYFGSDTASDKKRWFRRNGRGLTRDQAKRMAQDYIDRYGKERVYIGNIRHYR